MEEWNGRIFLRRSNIRVKISRKSYWNILNLSLSLSRNALFKGTVPLVATVVELDKEEQCNAAEGRGYANGNGWVRSLQQPILDNQ